MNHVIQIKTSTILHVFPMLYITYHVEIKIKQKIYVLVKIIVFIV